MPARVEGPLTPFYFGVAGEELFGVYHRPQGGVPRESAVVVCHPLGQEYIRAHRGLRQLAVRLADAGFPVLRFDLYGCGDSLGDPGDGTLERWREDVAAAVAEARARSAAERACLVGLRLGATLAALVGADDSAVDAVVLWEPVVGGRGYLDELDAQHAERLVLYPARVKASARERSEVLGFPVSEGLRARLAQVDLLGLPGRPARRALIVEGEATPEAQELKEALERLGCRVDYECRPTQRMWIEDINRIVVPHEALQAIVSWLIQAYA